MSKQQQVAFFVLLGVFLLSWLAARYTQFEERLIAHVEKEQVTLVTNDRTIVDTDARIGHVRNITVSVPQTFEQFGGGSLTIQVPGQKSKTTHLPPLWQFDVEHLRPPAGDWWIDGPTEPKVLASIPLDITPPFSLVAVVPGRVLDAFQITIDDSSDKPMVLGIRTGLMNNDVYLTRPDGLGHAWPAEGTPWLNVRRSLGPIAKGICLGAFICLLFSLLSCAQSGLPSRIERWMPSRRVCNVLAVILAVLRLGVACWVAWSVLFRLPTFQDDLCYYIRSQWLLAGWLDRPAPPLAIQEQLQFPFTAIINDRLLTPYPVNWSLLLAAGMAFDVPWIVAPICGALFIWVVFRFAQTLAGNRVGLLTALLVASSPFCVIFAGSMMNHTATMLFLAYFAFAFVWGWPESKPPRMVVLLGAGAALGFAFGIRPLTGAAVGLPVFLLGLWEWRLRRFSGKAFLGLVVFALGVFLGMTTTLIDNAMVTGNPFLFAYGYREAFRPLSERLMDGAFWSDRSMAQLPMLMSGWGWPWLRGQWWLCLPIALAAVPFLLGRANRHDWFALGLFFSVMIAYYSHDGGTIHAFGPRIYIDTLFALFFLTARGFQCLARSQPLFRDGAPGPWAWRVAALLAIALPLSTICTLKQRITLYAGYNAINREFLEKLEELKASRGLFLLEPDARLKWNQIAPLLPVEPATSPYVFAEWRPNNDAIIAAYGKDRPIFVVRAHEIVPFDSYDPPH